MDERLLNERVAGAREHEWIPGSAVRRLHDVVARYLDGERNLATDVDQLATAVAGAARERGHTPERMLIALRALWREFTISQHDRLQLAVLYDRIVRRAIDQYYRA